MNNLSLTISGTQTCCCKCSVCLRGDGDWFYFCSTYMHIKSSGMSSLNDCRPNLISIHCSEHAKIDLVNHLVTARHTQSRQSRNHTAFNKSFRTSKWKLYGKFSMNLFTENQPSLILAKSKYASKLPIL